MPKSPKRKAQKAPKYSNAQVNYLVDYIMTHKDFAAQRYASNTGTRNWTADWETIADDINSLGTTKKDPDGWRQAWKDLKARVRKKQGEIKTGRWTMGNKTGKPPVLSAVEMKVASILGKHYIEGLNEPECMEPTEEHLQALDDGDDSPVIAMSMSLNRTPDNPAFEVFEVGPDSFPPNRSTPANQPPSTIPSCVPASRPLQTLTPEERRAALMESVAQDLESDRAAGYEVGPGLASILSRSRESYIAIEERNAAAQEQTASALVSLASALDKMAETQAAALQQSREQHEMMLSVMKQQGRITEAALKALNSLVGRQ